MDNSKVLPIGFYYSSTVFMNGTTSEGIEQYPKIVNGTNGILTLTYSDGTVFEVSGTLQMQRPNSFVAHSFETDKLLYNGVTFNFSQLFISQMDDCDVWALDNVQVTVDHSNCSRVLLESSFDADPM